MPRSYQQLIDTVEAQLVIGPRGIGKTTLLKMLMPEAIDAWQTPEAERATKRIAFTGVFLQADKIWAGQFTRLASGLPTEGNPNVEEALTARFTHAGRFGLAAFCYLALAAFAEAAAYRCRRDGSEPGFRWIDLPRQKEEQLVAAIAPSWLAHKATATFDGLVSQMRNNLSTLARLMNRAANPDISEQDLSAILGDELVMVDFQTAAVEFIDAFNRAAGERDAPWVLLIDEFEFLPPSARLQIGEAFQGSDPRLSYKISLAPYTGVSPFAGSELNDWHKVFLTHRSTDDFSRRLMSRELESLGKAERVLAARGFDGPPKVTFGEGSRNAADVSRLAAVDATFEKWLQKRLRGRALHTLRDTEPAYRSIAKAMPLVRLRLARRRTTERGARDDGSPPKVLDLYAGAKNAYLLTEGNPRWIKALTYELRSRSGAAHSIPEGRQAEAVAKVANTLYDNLRSASIQHRSGRLSDGGEPEGGTDYTDVTPYGLLRRLGEHLTAQTHDAPFTPELPGVFAVDDLDPWLDDVLNTLIFLGALVVERRPPGATHERLRLAHMWAPLFDLLLTKGKALPLTQVLEDTPR